MTMIAPALRLLILHQNFPGQFRHLLTAWSSRKDMQIVGLGRQGAPGLSGVPSYQYRAPAAKREGVHGYLRQMEDAVRHGQAVARSLLELKRRGFTPDIVLAHPGWGETLYVRDIYPDAKLIHFCEWYYNPQGADLGFDPEFPSTLNDHARIRTWNALHALNLTNCNVGVSPTHWQRQVHPSIFQPKISLIHEGIDTEQLGPDPEAAIRLANGTILKAGDPIITYVARNLEPYRGFHSFMRALEIIQRRHKTCHALIVGGDNVSYGRRPTEAPSWRSKMLREVKLDPARTHFLGHLPYDAYRKILQISAAHVYLTYPFVLSWSMLEAMASGCLVIGSRTAPVEEIIKHGHNGWLVDFFDATAMADRVVDSLENPAQQMPLRRQAQRDVQARYPRRAGLAGYENLIRNVLPSEAHALCDAEAA